MGGWWKETMCVCCEAREGGWRRKVKIYIGEGKNAERERGGGQNIRRMGGKESSKTKH